MQELIENERKWRNILQYLLMELKSLVAPGQVPSFLYHSVKGGARRYHIIVLTIFGVEL
jgi:hypothetical protein